MMLEIYIDGIPAFAYAPLAAMIAVVIDLQGRTGAVRERVIPASQDVTGADGNLVVKDCLARQIVGEQRVDGLRLARLEEVALDGHGVFRRQFPVRPESHVRFVPPVRHRFRGRRGRVSEIRVVPENAVSSVPAGSAAVLQQPLCGFPGSRAGAHQTSGRGLELLGKMVVTAMAAIAPPKVAPEPRITSTRRYPPAARLADPSRR